MIPLILLILRRAWEINFVVFYGDPAPVAHFRTSLGRKFRFIYSDPAAVAHLRTKLGRHISMLFTVIPVQWLISGQAWEAHFDVIYGDPAAVAHLGTSSGSTFRRYL